MRCPDDSTSVQSRRKWTIRSHGNRMSWAAAEGGTVLAAEEVAAEEAGKGKRQCLRRPGSSGCQTGTRTNQAVTGGEDTGRLRHYLIRSDGHVRAGRVDVKRGWRNHWM